MNRSGLFADLPESGSWTRILFPWRQVVLVVAVAVVLRVVYWHLASGSVFFRTPIIDASFFDIWARALATGGGFQDQTFFKPPLYPYLLATLYRLGFGLAAVQLLQMAVGVVTAVLTLALGRLVFTPRAAFGGALAAALLPILPFFEGQLLAETWSTALTLGALLPATWLVTGRARATGRVLALAGVLLGVAALGRPNLMLSLVVLAAWLWRWGKRTGRLRPVGLLPLVLGFAVAIAPATGHNLRHGEFVLISANAGVNLLVGNSDEADGISAVPVGVRWDDLQLKARQAGAGRPGASSRLFTREAFAWIAAHPGRCLQLLGKKALLLVNAQEGRNNINPRWLATRDGVWPLARWWPGTWLLLPPAILGLAIAGRGRAPASLLRWLVLSQAAAVLPFFVNARFRAPLLPLAALFAAAGIAALWSRRATGRRGFAAGLAVLAVVFVLVNVDWFGLGGDAWLARDHYNRAMLEQRRPGTTPADIERVSAEFERALALNPDDPDFHESYGAFLLQMAQSRVDEARSLAQDERWDATAAPVAAARRLLTRAEVQHAEATRVYARSVRSWINRGVCRLWLGDCEAWTARRLLAHADGDAAQEHARAAFANYQQAGEALRQALMLDPGQSSAAETFDQVWEAVMRLPDSDPGIAAAQDALRSHGLVPTTREPGR